MKAVVLVSQLAALCHAAPKGNHQGLGGVSDLSASKPQCRATRDSQVSLRLPNGDIPWVAASSNAPFNGQWLVTGTPSFVWPAGSPIGFVPVADSFVGFTLTPRGAVRMVPNPIPGKHVLYPRVASSPRGWHALLFESRLSDESALDQRDSVGVWYAEYSHDRWIGLSRIAWVRRSHFRPEYTSNLVADQNGELAFAYPLNLKRPPKQGDLRGLVLLHTSGAAWKADTLWTRDAVVYVSLVAGLRPGSWEVLYNMRIAYSDHIEPAALFLAEFDGKWRTSPPSVIGQGRGLNSPSLLRIGPELYATWSQTTEGFPDFQKQTLKWTRLIDSATLVARSAPEVAGDAMQFTVTQLPGGKVVWALHDFSSTQRVRLAYAEMTHVFSVDTVDAPNDAYPHLIPLDASQFLLLTARLGGKSAPDVEHVMTTISIRCD